MSEKLHEQISAMMDGELDDGEAKLLVRRFEKDPELRAVWDRYQRCGRLISVSEGGDQHPVMVGRDFAHSVMDAIHKEEATPMPVSRWRDWLRPVAGLAVAAGVATVALVGLQGGQFGDQPESIEVVPGTAADASPWPSSARFAPASAGTRLGIDDPDPLQRLNTYRVNHTDSAAGLRRLDADEGADEQESTMDSEGPR